MLKFGLRCWTKRSSSTNDPGSRSSSMRSRASSLPFLMLTGHRRVGTRRAKRLFEGTRQIPAALGWYGLPSGREPTERRDSSRQMRCAIAARLDVVSRDQYVRLYEVIERGRGTDRVGHQARSERSSTVGVEERANAVTVAPEQTPSPVTAAQRARARAARRAVVRYGFAMSDLLALLAAFGISQWIAPSGNGSLSDQAGLLLFFAFVPGWLCWPRWKASIVASALPPTTPASTRSGRSSTP